MKKKFVVLDTNIYGWYQDYIEKEVRTSEAVNAFNLMTKIFENRDKIQVLATETIEKEIKRAQRSELTNLFYSAISGVIKNSKKVVELSSEYFVECRKESLNFVTLDDCEIVAATILSGVKSLVTENRKSLNNPKVKTIFQINSKRNLRDAEIKDCKSFTGDVFV